MGHVYVRHYFQGFPITALSSGVQKLKAGSRSHESQRYKQIVQALKPPFDSKQAIAPQLFIPRSDTEESRSKISRLST